ncbi:hypothetical protein IWQ60_003156 [Tieghemiomyces parasiticus]|uniref:Thymidylate kinase n=1 Tax=Tieghemiomyces parasiticus TaxID=78921 RepID=A0A9W8DWR2_9FUNG|nr:hypothetical protein IWQ60_003156 [Tieghemiomyces parasiticus]
MSRGAFILLEGCDRTGKSTQAQMLVDRLTQLGHRAILWKFPDRTTGIGHMINGYLAKHQDLNDQAIHLLFSANRWEAVEQLANHLRSGTHLVVDRYAYSGVAFSAAKGLDLEWCKQPDVGLLKPDLTFFLDMPIQASMQRGGFGEERYEKEELQTRVRDLFLKLREPDWKVVDATETIDQIHEKLTKAAQETIQTVASRELQYGLWAS